MLTTANNVWAGVQVHRTTLVGVSESLKARPLVERVLPESVKRQMDLTVDPCDDFYEVREQRSGRRADSWAAHADSWDGEQYSCGGFLKNVKIPEDLGGFARSWDGGSAKIYNEMRKVSRAAAEQECRENRQGMSSADEAGGGVSDGQGGQVLEQDTGPAGDWYHSCMMLDQVNEVRAPLLILLPLPSLLFQLCSCPLHVLPLAPSSLLLLPLSPSSLLPLLFVSPPLLYCLSHTSTPSSHHPLSFSSLHRIRRRAVHSPVSYRTLALALPKLRPVSDHALFLGGSWARLL